MSRILVLIASLAAALAFAAPSGNAGAEDPSVTYFEAGRVKSAFTKGEPLIEESNYKVHASRRDAGGQAEIHEADTDIVYMLEGSATFVTGGKMVDGKTTAPEEVRGASIQGGETRTLVKGDVIIVPRGTPHWFKEVKGPVTYYVVKVR
jgi:glc operon protein GlcG